MAVAAAADLKAVADVTERLQDLLELARSVKAEETVEPPLPVAALRSDVDSLHSGIADQSEQPFRFGVVETAARRLFYSFIGSANINEPGFVEVWNLFDVLLLCGDRGKCTPELVCWLIEELLDSQTTRGCRTVFDYLETRKERLVQKDFHKKNLIFLRSCNELLRRLSRAEDAQFCGRVFFFLFQTFPLGDKSSVNLRGEFHTENTTKFEEPAGNEVIKEGEQMDVDSVTPQEEIPKPSTPRPTGKAGSKAVPIKPPPKKAEEIALSTTDLYPIFWRLQQDFSDPVRLFTADNFKAFQEGLGYTLTKFKKTPTVVQAKSSDDSERGIKRKAAAMDVSDSDSPAMEIETDMSDSLADTYNPKYLTSRELFDLELGDMAFQRHILVQSLILIDFLLSLTDKAKKRLALLEPTNKSMLYQFTLGEDDAKWATSTRSSITSYMSSTLDGKLFNRMVETVLARDKNWIRWKIENCPSIVHDPVSAASEVDARRGAQNATRVRRVPDKPAGAINLDFLDDGTGGLDALRAVERFTAPSKKELIDGITTDKLDLEMAMDDEEKAGLENSIASKRWRVVRQARMQQLGLLNKIEPGKSLELPTPENEQTVVKEEDEAEIDDAGNVDAPEIKVVAVTKENGNADAGPKLEDEAPAATALEAASTVE